MTSTAWPRAGVVRFVVVALLASLLTVVAGTAPAAAESPPSFITKWGTPGNGNGQFNGPYGVAVDANRVYVADVENALIQRFTSDGAFVTQWGGFGTGNGQFRYPQGVAVDAGDGTVYVADSGNNRIQRFDGNGNFMAQWGTQGTGNGQFDDPQGVAAVDGTVYVVDSGNDRVQKFDTNGLSFPAGAYLTKWGSHGAGNSQFDAPRGVAVDERNGNVYVTDLLNHRVQKFTSDGAYLAQWGTYGTANSQFDRPLGVAVDADGDVYVTDSGNNRVQKFAFTGTFRFFLTKWGTSGTGDGQFDWPHGIAVDGDGSVYVADTANSRIQEFGDATDPTVDLRDPPDGAVYDWLQTVNADFSCADESGGSGIASCVGTSADGSPIATSTSGDHDFTVTATDRAGNTTTVTHTYTVRDVPQPARPDERIKKGAAGTYFGDGVYNTTGVGQTRTGSAARGSTITYFVSVQNDAPFVDAFRLRGTASTAAFRVLYSTGGIDITPQVTAGTYTTPTLSPGATLVVKVEVKVKVGAPAGSSLTGALTATSTTDPTIKDKVKFVTRRS